MSTPDHIVLDSHISPVHGAIVPLLLFIARLTRLTLSSRSRFRRLMANRLGGIFDLDLRDEARHVVPLGGQQLGNRVPISCSARLDRRRGRFFGGWSRRAQSYGRERHCMEQGGERMGERKKKKHNSHAQEIR